MAHSVQHNISNMVSINFSVKGASEVSKHAKEIGDGFETSWKNAKKALKDYQNAHTRLGNEDKYDAEVKALKKAVKTAEKDFKSWKELFEQGMVDYQKFVDYIMKYEGLGTPQLTQMLNAMHKTIKGMGPVFTEHGKAIEETQKKLSAMAQAERLFAAQTDARLKGVIDLTKALDRMNTTYGEASNYVKAYERNARDLAKSPEHLKEMSRAALQNKIAMHECVGEWKELNGASSAQDFQRGITTFKDISQWAKKFGIDIREDADMMRQLQTFMTHFGNKGSWSVLSQDEVSQNMKDLRDMGELIRLNTIDQQKLTMALNAGQSKMADDAISRTEAGMTALYGKNFEKIGAMSDEFLKQEQDRWEKQLKNAERSSEAWLRAKDAYAALLAEADNRKIKDAVSVIEGDGSAYAQMKQDAVARQDAAKAEMDILEVKMEDGKVVYKNAADEQAYAEAVKRSADIEAERLKIAEKKFIIQQKARELEKTSERIEETKADIEDRKDIYAADVEGTKKHIRDLQAERKTIESKIQRAADNEAIIESLEPQKKVLEERRVEIEKEINRITALKNVNEKLIAQEEKLNELVRQHGELVTEQEAQAARETLQKGLKSEIEDFLSQDVSGAHMGSEYGILEARARRYKKLVQEQMDEGTWDGPEKDLIKIDKAIDTYRDKLKSLMNETVTLSNSDETIVAAALGVDGDSSAIDKAIQKEKILKATIEAVTEAHKQQIISLGEKYGETETERDLKGNSYRRILDNWDAFSDDLIIKSLKNKRNEIMSNPVYDKDEDKLTKNDIALQDLLDQQFKELNDIIKNITKGTAESIAEARANLESFTAADNARRQKELAKYSYTETDNEVQDLISKLKVQEQRIGDRIKELDNMSDEQIKEYGSAAQDKLEGMRDDIEDLKDSLRLASKDTTNLTEKQEAYAEKVKKSKAIIAELEAKKQTISTEDKLEAKMLAQQDSQYKSYLNKQAEIKEREDAIGTSTGESAKEMTALTDKQRKRLEEILKIQQTNKDINSEIAIEKELQKENEAQLRKVSAQLNAINGAKKDETKNQQILNDLIAKEKELSKNIDANTYASGKREISKTQEYLAREREDVRGLIKDMGKKDFDFTKAYFKLYDKDGAKDFRKQRDELTKLRDAINAYENGDTNLSKHEGAKNAVMATIAELEKERAALGQNVSMLNLLDRKIQALDESFRNAQKHTSEVANNQAMQKMIGGKGISQTIKDAEAEAIKSTDKMSGKLRGLVTEYSELGKTKADPYLHLIKQSSEILKSFDSASEGASTNWQRYVTGADGKTNIFAETIAKLRSSVKEYYDATEKRDKNGNIVSVADIDRMHKAGDAVHQLAKQLKEMRPKVDRSVMSGDDIDAFSASVSRTANITMKSLQPKDITDPYLSAMATKVTDTYQQLASSMTYQTDKEFKTAVDAQTEKHISAINEAIAKFKEGITKGVSDVAETELRKGVTDAFNVAVEYGEKTKALFDTRSMKEVKADVKNGTAVMEDAAQTAESMHIVSTATEEATKILARYQKQKETGMMDSNAEAIETNKKEIQTLEHMLTLRHSYDESLASITKKLNILKDAKEWYDYDNESFSNEKKIEAIDRSIKRWEEKLKEAKSIMSEPVHRDDLNEDLSDQEYLDQLIRMQTEAIKEKEKAEKELAELEKTLSKEQIDADRAVIAKKDELTAKLRSLNEEFDKNARAIEAINHAEENSSNGNRFSKYSIDQIKEAMRTWQEAMRKCFNDEGKLTGESKEYWKQLNEQYQMADKYLHSVAERQNNARFASLRKSVLGNDGNIDANKYLALDSAKQQELMVFMEKFARKALSYGTARGQSVFERLTKDALALQEATRNMSGVQQLMQMERDLAKTGQTSTYYDAILKKMAELRDSGKLTAKDIQQMDDAIRNFAKAQSGSVQNTNDWRGTNEELKTLISYMVRYRDMIKDPMGGGRAEWQAVEGKIKLFQEKYEELTAMRAKAMNAPKMDDWDKWIEKATIAQKRMAEAKNPANGMDVAQMESLADSYRKMLHEGLSLTANPNGTFIKGFETEVNKMFDAVETKYRDMMTKVFSFPGVVDKAALTSMTDGEITKLQAWMEKESTRLFANGDMNGFRRMAKDIGRVKNALAELGAEKSLHELWGKADKQKQTSEYYNNVIRELEKLRDSGNLAAASVAKVDDAINSARANQEKSRRIVENKLRGGSMFQWDSTDPTKLLGTDFSGRTIEDLEKVKAQLMDMRKYLKPDSEMTVIRQTDIALDAIQQTLDSTTKKMRELEAERAKMSNDSAWEILNNPLQHSADEVSKAMKIMEDASRQAASGATVTITENGTAVSKTMEDIQQHVQMAKNAMDKYALDSKLPQMETQLGDLNKLTDEALKSQATYWKQMIVHEDRLNFGKLAEYKQHLGDVVKRQNELAATRGNDAMNALGSLNVNDLSLSQLKDYIDDLGVWRNVVAANSSDYTAITDKMNELIARQRELNRNTAEGKESFLHYKDEALKLGEDGYDMANFKGTFQDLQNYKKALEELKLKLSPTDPKDADTLNKLNMAYQNIKGTLTQVEKKTKTFGNLTEDTYLKIRKAVQKNQKEVHRGVNTGKFSIEDVRNTLARLKHELETNKWQEWANDIDQAKSIVARMNNEIKTLNEETQEQTSWLDDAIDKLRNNLMIFTGGTTLVQKIPEAFQANVLLSDEMTNVAKVANMNRGEIEDLTNRLQALDTRHTTDQLMQMAEQAGKLGIYTRAGAEGMVGFVSAAEKITGTLGEDIGGAEAVANLVKVSDLINGQGGDIEEKLNRLGSAILMVGNNSAASYKDVSDFLQATGAVGKTAGMSIPQLTAIGATLSSLGSPIDASATSINKFLVGLSRNIEQVAYITDLSATELRRMVDEGNTFEAFIHILDKIGESGNGMSQMIYKVLDAFGGRKNAQLIQTLSVMAQNTQRLREELGYATEGYEDGTLMATEFHKANNNLAGSLERMKNEFNELFVNTGWQSALEDLVNGIRSFVENIKGFTVGLGMAIISFGAFIKLIVQFNTVTKDTWMMLQLKNLAGGLKVLLYTSKAAVLGLGVLISKLPILGKHLGAVRAELNATNASLKAASSLATANWVIAIAAISAMLISYLIQLQNISEKVQDATSKIAQEEEDKYRKAAKALDESTQKLRDSIKAKDAAVAKEKDLRSAHYASADSAKKNADANTSLDKSQDSLTASTEEGTEATDEARNAHDDAARATREHHQVVQDFNSNYATYIGFEIQDADSAELVALAHYKVANALREEADARQYQRTVEQIENLYNEDIQTDEKDILRYLQTHYPKAAGEILGRITTAIRDAVENGTITAENRVFTAMTIADNILNEYREEAEIGFTWRSAATTNAAELAEDYLQLNQSLKVAKEDYKKKQEESKQLTKEANEALSAGLLRELYGESSDEVANRIEGKGATKPGSLNAPFLSAEIGTLTPRKIGDKPFTAKLDQPSSQRDEVKKIAGQLPSLLERLGTLDASEIGDDRLEMLSGTLSELTSSLSVDRNKNTLSESEYNKAIDHIVKIKDDIKVRLNRYRKTRFWGTEDGKKGFDGYRPETLGKIAEAMDEFQAKVTDNMNWDEEGVRGIFTPEQIETLKGMNSGKEASAFIRQQVLDIWDYLDARGLNRKGRVKRDTNDRNKAANEAKKRYEALIKELDDYFELQRLAIEKARANNEITQEEHKHRLDVNNQEHKNQRAKLRNMFEAGYKDLYDEETGSMTDTWIDRIFGRGQKGFSTSTWKTALAHTRKLLHTFGDSLMDDIKLKSTQDRVEMKKILRGFQDEFEQALMDGKPLEKALDAFEQQADKLHLLFGLKDFYGNVEHTTKEYQQRMEVMKDYSVKVASMTEDEFRQELGQIEGFRDRAEEEYTLLYEQLQQLHDSYDEAIRKKAKKEAKLLQNRVESGMWYEAMFKKYDAYVKALETNGEKETDAYRNVSKARKYFQDRLTQDGVTYYHKQEELLKKMQQNAKVEESIGGMGIDSAVWKQAAEVSVARQQLLMSREDLVAKESIYLAKVNELEDVRNELSKGQHDGESDEDYAKRRVKLQILEFELNKYRVANEEIVKQAKEKNIEASDNLIAKERELMNQRIQGINQWRTIFDELNQSMMSAGSSEADSKNWEIVELRAKRMLGLVSDTERQRMIILKKSGDYEVKWLTQEETIQEEKRIAAMNARAEAWTKFFHDFGEKMSQSVNDAIMHAVQKNLAQQRAKEVADVEANAQAAGLAMQKQQQLDYNAELERILQERVNLFLNAQKAATEAFSSDASADVTLHAEGLDRNTTALNDLSISMNTLTEGLNRWSAGVIGDKSGDLASVTGGGTQTGTGMSMFTIGAGVSAENGSITEGSAISGNGSITDGYAYDSNIPEVVVTPQNNQEIEEKEKEHQNNMTKAQLDSDNKRKKSATATAQAMMQAMNLYGTVYQAVTNQNLSSHERASQAMLGAVGQVVNAGLSAALAEYTAKNAMDESSTIGQAFAKLGPIKGAMLVAGITAMFGMLLGMVTNAISKGKAKVSAITGASSAGRLSTGMLTYASGRYYDDIGMGGNNGGVSFGNDISRQLGTPLASSAYQKGRSYRVHGNDGMDYDATFEGRALATGIRKDEHFGIFSEKKPELVIDGNTTDKLVHRYPGIYSSILDIAAGKDPQLGLDYGYITRQLNKLGMMQAQGRGNLAKGMPTFAVGSYPYSGDDIATAQGMGGTFSSTTGASSSAQAAAQGLSNEVIQNLVDVLTQLRSEGVSANLDIVELDKRQKRYNRWKEKNGLE